VPAGALAALGVRLVTRQLDLYRHSPQALAASYRQAAETARRDPHFSPEDGEKRARHYLAEAERYERSNISDER